MSRRSAAVLAFMMMIGVGASLFVVSHAHQMARTPSQQAFAKASSVSIPLFFEPNQGQTDLRVKFLARGHGYGIFLTVDEAVLELQPSAVSQPSSVSAQKQTASVIRMHLDRANKGATVSGAEQLPGKSNYFIGNDSSRWHRDIPQFARVEYKAVYPGVDLVYYAHEGQLEYDFHVAPSADPNQIALDFDGAYARLEGGDLLLATERGEVRFHAPRVYQVAAGAQKDVAGSFRQIADNKIGFTVGEYDRSRELVIDPMLSYSTYLGGSAAESSVSIAVGADNNIYVAGSTMSSNFPVTSGALQSTLAGAQNIFIAVINPTIQPPASQLLYATYLGGNGTDTASGVAVAPHIDSSTTGYDVYVAGYTSSTDFPVSTILMPFESGPPTDSNVHSFVSRLNIGKNQLSYSTYLIGNGVDKVSGLAIDSKGDAFVTGTTTSTNPASAGFPATINAFQPCPWQPPSVGVNCAVTSGPTQFFASEINTGGSGSQSMLYSTFFGGGYTSGTEKISGGGIAVDTSGNMYFTGGTNMPGIQGPNPTDYPFPLVNAQQSCLDQASQTSSCTSPAPTAADAFVVKINPNVPNQAPAFSTYLGGSGDDYGFAVAVDGASSVYVTGKTDSGDWLYPTAVTPFQQCLNNTAAAPPCPGSSANDAFIAKVPSPAGGVAPLIYFTFMGGSGDESGQAITVDANQGAHVIGTTDSSNLPVVHNLYPYSGSSTDAFVGLVSTTIGATNTATGNYLTYLGGTNGTGVGTGIAIDINNATYVSGTTTSTDFPVTNGSTLNGSQPDAFVTKLGASSGLSIAVASNSPSPNPVPAGTQAAFTFDITNSGPDTATTVVFVATIPSSGLTATSSAKVTSGSGSCTAVVGNTITCTLNTLAVSTTPTGVVEVDLTPSVPLLIQNFTVSGAVVSANGTSIQGVSVTQPAVSITDFSVSVTPASITIPAGQGTAFNVTLTPNPTYTATISMADSGLPAASTGTFTVTPVVMSGNTAQTTTLNISTTARPVSTGSLFRGHMFYATWLPVGGLSLLGLGVGASQKRRRWIAGALLGLIAGIVLLQPGCGNSTAASATGGTPAGNYVLTITATNNNVSHPKTVLLVVQ